MGTIVVIIALIIFLLFALKKDYGQLLVFLIVCLILNGIIVNALSTNSLIGTMAISVKNPILSVLIYAVIELICMGTFYYMLKKYNRIIALIVYLVINLIINIFYMTISGNILLDLVFNFIIGSIILIAYKEILEMEAIKWFVILGVIIDTVCTLLIANTWEIILGIIWLLGVLFRPLIICAGPGLIVFAIIMWLTRKRFSKKSETFKIIFYVIILICCECISMTVGSLYIIHENQRYEKIKEASDKQSIIELSKEQEEATLIKASSKLDG